VKFLNYAQGVDAFRLTNRISANDKAKLMGGTLTRIYGWAPG
jgi:L-fuconolactonase